MERLTLDMTAVRDVVDDTRERHREGLALLRMAERGEVEVGVPPQGSRADLHGDLAGDLAQRIEALQSRPGVVGLPQLSLLSDVTFPGGDLLPGNYVDGFDQAWEGAAASWKTHLGSCPGDLDRWYVHAHIAAGRDVLITEDRPLQAMCDRLREEHDLAIHAESLAGYLARRG